MLVEKGLKNGVKTEQATSLRKTEDPPLCLAGLNNFVRDVKFMLDVELGIYWKFCWLVFIPLSLSGILVYVLCSMELPTMDGLYYPISAYGM